MGLFVPTYFSPISQYGAIFKSSSLEFETADNFQKQTYRNRCYIYGANGKQLLNIPISYPKTEDRKKTKDILIEEGSNWQTQHYKSIQTAYNSSPFFEFYKDDLMKIFEKKYKYLLDVNIDSFLFINESLELQKQHSLTKEYQNDPTNDYRILANVKLHPKCLIERYIQVFDSKFGFINNLSILDLLFMEGPNAISYLEKVNVTLR